MKPKTFKILFIILINVSFFSGLQAQNNKDQFYGLDSTINLADVGTSLQLNQEQLQSLPFHKLSSFGLLSPSAYRLKGDRMFYYGIEANQNHTFIDGMQVKDASNFPLRLIQSYNLYTNQAPINLGFTIGGITRIKTLQENDFTVLLDVSSDLAFNMQGVNGEIFINIPLASKKEGQNKRLPTLLIAGKYVWTNNTDPIWQRTQTINPEALSRLNSNPLRLVGAGQTGTYSNSAFVTSEDMMDQKVPDNSGKNGIYPFLKLSLPITENASLSIGSYSAIEEQDLYNHTNAMFNTSNNAVSSRRNFDNYLNWNHHIEVNSDLSLVYDINFQYSNYYQKTESKRHRDNFFDYGYVGNFTTYKTPTYELGNVKIDGYYYEDIMILNSWDFDTLVTFQASNINPGLAAYTNNFYDLYSGNPYGNYMNLDQIQLSGGLINGDNPNGVYEIWNNTGKVYSNYQEKNLEKIRFTLNFKIEYKSHHFQIGGEYNSEVQSHYSLSPVNLWGFMRGLSNFHLGELDKDNPYFSGTDTVSYMRKYDGDSQFEFDKNLRKLLGLPTDGLDFILIDSYDKHNNTISYYDKYGSMHTINTPDNFLSLDMFSESELLNNGGSNSFVNYSGYDHYSNKLNGRTDPYSFFDDFAIDASRPQYWAAFIQDEFEWKNLRVRVGLRMDVYDANRPVLKDVYSLFPIYSVEEALDEGNLEFYRPSNIGDDYLLYVDNVTSPSKLMGFRNNEIWYNAEGLEIYDPSILDAGAGISPYLKNPEFHQLGEEGWAPEMTFQDYSRSMNILPQFSVDYTFLNRINIYTSFSSFTQNPQYYSDFRPDEYYYWRGGIINNSALKPIRASKFFVGFKGNIWRNITADLSYFVTTIDNLIYLKIIQGVYPSDYTTLVNSENSIYTKGLQARLDLNNPLSSGAMGGISLTKLFPQKENLNYSQVSDLVFNAYLTYRFGSDNGPLWTNSKALNGFGASIFYQYRRGTPYYASNAYNSATFAKTPAVNLFNLNIQKDFYIGKNSMINVYLIIENLFNFNNVFKVYPETGQAGDDGFLTDPANQNLINNQLSPDSYRLLYQLQLYNPEYYDIPRIWRIGAVFRY